MDYFAQLAARWDVESPRAAAIVAHVAQRPEVSGDQLRALNEVQHAVTADLAAMMRGGTSALKTLFLKLIIERATRGGVTELVDDAARSALESLKLHDH